MPGAADVVFGVCKERVMTTASVSPKLDKYHLHLQVLWHMTFKQWFVFQSHKKKSKKTIIVCTWCVIQVAYVLCSEYSDHAAFLRRGRGVFSFPYIPYPMAKAVTSAAAAVWKKREGTMLRQKTAQSLQNFKHVFGDTLLGNCVEDVKYVPHY